MLLCEAGNVPTFLIITEKQLYEQQCPPDKLWILRLMEYCRDISNAFALRHFFGFLEVSRPTD